MKGKIYLLRGIDRDGGKRYWRGWYGGEVMEGEVGVMRREWEGEIGVVWME